MFEITKHGTHSSYNRMKFILRIVQIIVSEH